MEVKIYEKNRVESVSKELDEFQKVLDDKDVVMRVKDLRAWAGHINFVLNELIINVNDSFKKLIDAGLIEGTEPEMSPDVGGFYS